MGKLGKKKDTSERILRRQIERNAAAYTDAKIDELKRYISSSENDESSEEDELYLIEPEDPNDPEGSGDGSGLGVIFPPDNPTNWIIPTPPIRDITQVGVVNSIVFQKSDGTFEYDEDASYGYTYLSSDGALTSSVTIKVEGEGDIEDFEIQVTKID